jgi:hypothetical protein
VSVFKTPLIMDSGSIAIFNRRVVNGKWVGRIDRNGYGVFKIKGRTVHAHSAALGAILGGIPAGKCVEHICELIHASEPNGAALSYRGCIDVSHLRLGDDLSNNRRTVVLGRRNPNPALGDRNGSRRFPERLKRGVECHSAKLKPSVVRLIRTMRAKGATFTDLAYEFGVTRPAVRKLCERETWKHVT